MGRKGRGKSQTAAVKPVEPEVLIEEPVPEPPPPQPTIGDKRLQKQQEKFERDEKERLQRQAETERQTKMESKAQSKKKTKSQRVKLDRPNHSSESSQPATPAKTSSVPKPEVQRMILQEADSMPAEPSSSWADDEEQPAEAQATSEPSSETARHHGTKTVYSSHSRTQPSRDGGTSHFKENRRPDNRRTTDNSYSRGSGSHDGNQRGGRSHDSAGYGNDRRGGNASYNSSRGGQQYNAGRQQNSAQDWDVSTWTESPEAGQPASYQNTAPMESEAWQCMPQQAAEAFAGNYQQDDTTDAKPRNQRRDQGKPSRWDQSPRANTAPNYNHGQQAGEHANTSSGNFSDKKRKNDYGGDGDQQRFGRNNRNNRDRHKDAAYGEFDNLCSQTHPLTYGKLVEETGDLFNAPIEYSLAHCVAADMSMGAGIAKTFRSKFGRVAQLLNQRATTGGLAVLPHNDRYIYYLVSKDRSYGKPTMYTLWQSLVKLREHCQQHQVTKLAIPQIGCGLDRLDWSNVKQMLEFVFKDTDMHIVVYSLNADMLEDKRVKKAWVNHQKMSLVDIEKGTGHIYFGYMDSSITDDIKSLSEKFNFLTDYQTPGKQISDVIRTESPADVVYGIIVGQTPHDLLDFEKLNRGLQQLAKYVKTDKYNYVGLQAFDDATDSLIIDKILTLMQYTLRDVEIWVCWPKDIEHLCPQPPVRG